MQDYATAGQSVGLVILALGLNMIMPERNLLRRNGIGILFTILGACLFVGSNYFFSHPIVFVWVAFLATLLAIRSAQWLDSYRKSKILLYDSFAITGGKQIRLADNQPIPGAASIRIDNGLPIFFPRTSGVSYYKFRLLPKCYNNVPYETLSNVRVRVSFPSRILSKIRGVGNEYWRWTPAFVEGEESYEYYLPVDVPNGGWGAVLVHLELQLKEPDNPTNFSLTYTITSNAFTPIQRTCNIQFIDV